MSDGKSIASPDDKTYEELVEAVMETRRGRWFLEEFARRNRQADTVLLLEAIERLERLIAAQPAPGAPAARDLNALFGAEVASEDLSPDACEAVSGKLAGQLTRIAQTMQAHAAAAAPQHDYFAGDEDLFEPGAAAEAAPPAPTPAAVPEAPDGNDTLDFGTSAEPAGPAEPEPPAAPATRYVVKATATPRLDFDPPHPSEEEKKRIVIIRRPSREQGQIPLAGEGSDTHPPPAA